jgi:hypothetical protein
MTDEIGMLQFSQESRPNPRSGYTLDDNARALMVSIYMGEDGYDYARLFLNYLDRSQMADGTWSNFLLDGQYSARFDSEDSIGRAIMACSCATRSSWPDLEAQASRIIMNNIKATLGFSSPRAIAYTLVGLCKAQLAGPDKRQQEIVKQLADYLLGLYAGVRSRDWRWFEDSLTYSNAILPQALFSVYSFNGDKKCLQTAYESLVFLNDILFSQGYLNIIGNQGWYHRSGHPAGFDQQPVDAASMAFACWEAYHDLGNKEYLDLAELAHQWYRGKNIHGLSLFDTASGGCYDALTQEGVNLNQGAESVLSLLFTDLLLGGTIGPEFQLLKSSS